MSIIKCIQSNSKNNLKVRITIFILFCVLLLSAAAMLLMHRGKGGSRISGDAYYAVTFPSDVYPDYNQRNKAWAGDKLGTSRDTMKKSGCLTCCIAASLKAQGIYDYTPGQLNQLFNEQGVYNKDGAIVWNKLESVLTGVKVDLDNDLSGPTINRMIKEGKYPIVKVKRKSGGMHWIVLTGTEKDVTEKGSHDIIAMDPIDGYVHLSDYSDTIYSVRVVSR